MACGRGSLRVWSSARSAFDLHELFRTLEPFKLHDPVGSANVSVLADADGKLNKVLSVDDATQESSVTIPQNEWNQSTGADYSRLSGACQFR
jgi:hypothetical protein